MLTLKWVIDYTNYDYFSPRYQQILNLCHILWNANINLVLSQSSDDTTPRFLFKIYIFINFWNAMLYNLNVYPLPVVSRNCDFQKILICLQFESKYMPML